MLAKIALSLSATEIMDREDYVSKVNVLLDNKESCSILSSDTLTSIKKISTNKLLDNLRRQSKTANASFSIQEYLVSVVVRVSLL